MISARQKATALRDQGQRLVGPTVLGACLPACTRAGRIEPTCACWSARDRILDLGGTCDPVDVMEANDVDLQAARRVLDSQAVRK